MYDVAQYFLEVESVSKLSTHSLSSRQVHFFSFSLSLLLFICGNIEVSRMDREMVLPTSLRGSRVEKGKKGDFERIV